MTRVRLIAIVLGLAAAMFALPQAKPASHVGSQGQMGGLELLTREDVQADLALTKAQQDRLAEIRKQMNAATRALYAKGGGTRDEIEALQSEQKSQIENTLTPEQLARIKQIALQLKGNTAITYPETASALGFSAEQSAATKTLVDEHLKAMAGIIAKVRERKITSEEARKEISKRYVEHEANLAKILTPEQATKFAEMRGKVFVPTPPPSNKIGG